MIRTMHISLCLVTSLLLFLSCQLFVPTPLFDDADLSPWQSDLQYLFEELPRVHANMFKYVSREEWRDGIRELGNSVNVMDDDSVIVEIMKILALIRASHTRVCLDYYTVCYSGINCETTKLSYAFGTFPMQVEVFEEGIYIIKAGVEYGHLLGKRLTAVHNVPIDEVISQLRTLLPDINDSYYDTNLPRLLVCPEILHAMQVIPSVDMALFSFVDSHDVPGEVLLFGEDIEVQDYFIDFFSYTGVQPPVYLYHSDRMYWSHWDAATNLFYLNYSDCREDPENPIPDFIGDVQDEIAGKSIEKLVIDLRMNQGGNFNLMHPYFMDLVQDSDINRQGKLFVIVGKKTYSSGFDHMEYFDTWSHAIIIGESPATKPYHGYGQTRDIALKNSGVRIYYSSHYNCDLFVPDIRSYIPDVVIPSKAADYFNGQDACLNYLIARD